MAGASSGVIGAYPPEDVGSFGRERSERPALAIGAAEEGVGFGVVDDLALQRVVLKLLIELRDVVDEKQHFHVVAGAAEVRLGRPLVVPARQPALRRAPRGIRGLIWLAFSPIVGEMKPCRRRIG